MIERLGQYLSSSPWNSETVYEAGLDVKRSLEQARSDLSKVFKAKPDHLVFTSGGTEGNNLSLHILSKNIEDSKQEVQRPRVIWASATAHPSQLKPATSLESQGWELHLMPTTRSGAVDIEALSTLPKPDLVAIEWVNSEVGFVQPIEELLKLKADHSFKIWVDGVQGLGKVPLLDLSKVDAFVFSGHKLGAPVGVGGLLLSQNLSCTPLSLGGGQERGWRSGTVAVPLILCLRDAVLEGISAIESQLSLPKVDLEMPRHRAEGQQYSPYIVMVDTSPVDGEILVHQMASEGMMVGLGSACRSSRKKPSAAHEAMGLSVQQSRQSVRLSFSRFSNHADVAKALGRLQELWEASRKYY
jgi:cysteine desulfurase